MDKKPLIAVSLCAVVLLVLGSLSNVVGFQSVKSTVNDSPLFQTRTLRAIEQKQNILTFQYLGMGKQNPLQFPFRDNRTEQLKKAVDFISKMNDKTFAQFIELYIQKARQDNTFNGISDYQIIQALLLLKTNPEAILNIFTNKNNQDITLSYWPTLCQKIPFCIAFNILGLIVAVAVIIYLAIREWKNGPTVLTCFTACQCPN